MLVTLRTLARRWLIPTHEQDLEEVKRREEIIVDWVVREQFLNILPRQIRDWLLQQQLDSAADIAQKLREYRLIQRESLSGVRRGQSKGDFPNYNPCTVNKSVTQRTPYRDGRVNTSYSAPHTTSYVQKESDERHVTSVEGRGT